jgi:hypothetical protein
MRLVGVCALLLLLATPGRSQEARTLSRVADTVVVPGRAIGRPIVGAPLSRLRLYAARGGALAPILFQVDQRLPDGRYCYDQGPADHRLADDTPGALDEADELVLLARDAGDRLPPAQVVVAGMAAARELELRDPLDGGRAWVYALRFDGPTVPPLAPGGPLVWLTVRPHEDDGAPTCSWRGETFVFDNGRARQNAVRLSSLRFVDAGAVREPSLLDSLMIRAVATFMWVEVTRRSDDIRVHIGGWHAGPLRVIAEDCMEVYLALGLWASAPGSSIILTRDCVRTPTNVHCPVDLDASGTSEYTVCLDVARAARGWKFYNSNNPQPVDIDGRASAAERRLDRSWPAWNCVYGPEGAVISVFDPPQAMRRARNALVYLDDERRQPEDEGEGIDLEPGALGRHGFYVDIRGLAEGDYPGEYALYFAPAPFAPGDEASVLNQRLHPLEVRATAP